MDFQSLSLEQKIGQLFFIGLPGPDLDEASSGLLEEVQAGGICLFQRNIKSHEQVRNLLDGIRRVSRVVPFLSLDQEGGSVDRLRRIMEPMPAPSSLGSLENARKLATITARVIRILGFNMNFAPVIDVATPDRKVYQNGLQSRVFGEGPENAAEFGMQYLSALQAEGIIGCIKHFPGIGASRVDSHDELPQVAISPEDFKDIDLFPYRSMIKEGDVKSVMAGHAAFPFLDLQETDSNGKLLPSSLSFNFINNLLRKTLGFNGLAITDDLEMGAILKNYGMGDACRMAVGAGDDMLLVCANPEAVREGFYGVLEAVENGSIPESRIDESLQRISLLKNLIMPPPDFDPEEINALSDQIRELKNSIV